MFEAKTCGICRPSYLNLRLKIYVFPADGRISSCCFKKSQKNFFLPCYRSLQHPHMVERRLEQRNIEFAHPKSGGSTFPIYYIHIVGFQAPALLPPAALRITYVTMTLLNYPHQKSNCRPSFASERFSTRSSKAMPHELIPY